MRIGVIYVAWQTEGYIAPSLESWIRARHDQTGGHTYVICAVSVPFRGFPNDEPLDGTISQLTDYLKAGEIDHLITEPTDVLETEARGAALTYLLSQGVEAVVQVDSDEFMTLDQIRAIFAFVAANPFVAWFRLSLRNAVFDTKTYLLEPFTPPRIHRVQVGSFKATHFSADNDIAYGALSQNAMSSLTIPKELVWVSHLTWLDDLRSKRKVEYQTRARGWESSYRWNYETDHLEFNEAFYRARGLPLPQIGRDSS